MSLTRENTPFISGVLAMVMEMYSSRFCLASSTIRPVINLVTDAMGTTTSGLLE
ncbi:hypothetical protein D3C75_1376410 [compost metagenome]